MPIHTKTNPMSNQRQRGVGLVEILVAVLVLAIGFLAAARMQVHGMRFSQSAYYSSQAFLTASDIIDRMRNNSKGVIDGHYNDAETSAIAVSPECGTNYCDEADLARQDIYDWSARLHPLRQSVDGDGNLIGNFVAVLPGTQAIPAKGKITSLGSGVYRITISWFESVRGADTTQTLDVNFATEDT